MSYLVVIEISDIEIWLRSCKRYRWCSLMLKCYRGDRVE
jgi:hypothetical protein